MTNTTHQIEQLRIGGYLTEADTLERLVGSMNLQEEFKYLMTFAASGDFDFQLYRNQLRALWTAYCFHAEMDVDTGKYDSKLHELWAALPKTSELCGIDWHDLDSFDGFMCAYLV